MSETHASTENSLLDAAVTRLRALTDGDGVAVFARVEKRWSEFTIATFPVAIVQPDRSEPWEDGNDVDCEGREIYAIVEIINANGDEEAAVQWQTWLVAQVEALFRGQSGWTGNHLNTHLGTSDKLTGNEGNTFVGRSMVHPIFQVQESW